VIGRIDQLRQLSREDLYSLLQTIGELIDNHSSFDDLCQLAAKRQRTCTLCAWHDHATILGNGFIMITIHVIFDKAVFLTSTEYKEVTGECPGRG